jgi:hypothetical protein
MVIEEEVLSELLDEIDDVARLHPECFDGDACQACFLRRELVAAAQDARGKVERSRLLNTEART